jgi:ankyrin repeat protein
LLQDGNPVLMWAIVLKNKKLVDLLVDAGADRHIQTTV